MPKPKRRRRALSQTDEALLLREFEKLAARSDQRASENGDRRLREKSTKRSKSKRKTKKVPKPKRTSAKAIGQKYNKPFLTKEISHEFTPPLIVRHNSDVFPTANKIFDRIQKSVRFKKGKYRYFSLVFRYKKRYQRGSRLLSTLVEEIQSSAELYSLVVTGVEKLINALDEYRLRNQNVRISEVILKEYRDIPK